MSFYALFGGFSLPYDIKEQHPTSWGKWEHFHALRQSDQKPFSLFRLTAGPKDGLILEAARNGIKVVRTTKHPRVLTFEWTGETDAGGNKVLYLVTEAVQPLSATLKELDLSGEQRTMFIALALRQAAQAVAFVNNQCKLLHGNVSMETMLVTPELDLRLGFFDMASEHARLSSSLLARCANFVAEEYKCAELARGDIEALSAGPPWSADAWGLGCLMQELFRGAPLTAPEDLRDMNVVPKEVSSEYQKLLSQNPARRLNPNKLAESEFLKNDLIDAVHFLENLSIREPLEKTKFFRALPKTIPLFPPVICTRKLLPLIANALEFGGAPALALGCLLQIGKMLGDEEAFKARVVPIISALFASADHTIRATLISNINDYAPFLSLAVVEQSIFPQLLKGLQAGNAYVREQALKAMLPIAPKLSQRTLSAVLLKHLARLQVDTEPSIRANTTVLLGNLAPLLGAATCKRILLNAFTRALRDVFPPSRIAALKALVATAAFHSSTDVAARVVPALSPMMLDSVADVRAAACKAMDFFMKRLRQASADIARGVDPSAPPASADAAVAAADAATGVTSLIGWAMSTITSSLTTPNATPQKLPPASPAASTGGGGSAKRNLTEEEGWAVAAVADSAIVATAAGAVAGKAAVGAAAALGDAGIGGTPVDTSSLDMAAEEAWGDEWGDNEVTEPEAPSPRARIKPKPKLKLTKKRDGKGD